MNANLVTIVGLALALQFGAVFALLYTKGRLRRFRHLATLATASGQVVRITRNNEGKDTATIEYRNAQGMTLTTVCSLGKDFSEGSSGTVSYDPFDSAQVLVKEEVEPGARGGKLVFAILFGLGTVLLAVAIVGHVMQ